MRDKKYCYPNSNVLINKKNLVDAKELFEAEIKYTGLRLMELQENPIVGNFDLKHLCKIHRYVFQDLSGTTHKEMLEASIVAFNKADNSKLYDIFKRSIVPENEYEKSDATFLSILTSDDLDIEDVANSYEYYE